jgi:hypothetical protein
VQNDGKSLFTSHGDTVMATEYARGPWDPRACHGGPVSALLVRAAEAVDDGTVPWQLARITVDLVRPVPVLVPLRPSCTIERPGRLVSLVGCSLATEDGVEVARAAVLRVRRAEVDLTGASEPEPVFAEPGVGSRERSPWAGEETAFHKDAVELVFSEGAFDAPGPVSMWCRLLVPLFDGEEPSGAQRSVCAADFSNGVSSELEAETMLFINPDLTVHLLRPPVGEWIGVRARSHYGVEGAGLADTALYDELGRVGRAAQSLLLAPR